jgi:hypothetical protein
MCSKYGTFYYSHVIDVSSRDLRYVAGRGEKILNDFVKAVSELYGRR